MCGVVQEVLEMITNSPFSSQKLKLGGMVFFFCWGEGSTSNIHTQANERLMFENLGTSKYINCFYSWLSNAFNFKVSSNFKTKTFTKYSVTKIWGLCLLSWENEILKVSHTNCLCHKLWFILTHKTFMLRNNLKNTKVKSRRLLVCFDLNISSHPWKCLVFKHSKFSTYFQIKVSFTVRRIFVAIVSATRRRWDIKIPLCLSATWRKSLI